MTTRRVFRSTQAGVPSLTVRFDHQREAMKCADWLKRGYLDTIVVTRVEDRVFGYPQDRRADTRDDMLATCREAVEHGRFRRGWDV